MQFFMRVDHPTVVADLCDDNVYVQCFAQLLDLQRQVGLFRVIRRWLVRQGGLQVFAAASQRRIIARCSGLPSRSESIRLRVVAVEERRREAVEAGALGPEEGRHDVAAGVDLAQELAVGGRLALHPADGAVAVPPTQQEEEGVGRHQAQEARAANPSSSSACPGPALHWLSGYYPAIRKCIRQANCRISG